MARSQGRSRQSRLSTGAGGGGSNRRRQKVVSSSAGGDDGLQRSSINSRVSSLRQKSATGLSGPRRAAFGNLRMSVSPQDLRRMVEILNAGRRRWLWVWYWLVSPQSLFKYHVIRNDYSGGSSELTTRVFMLLFRCNLCGWLSYVKWRKTVHWWKIKKLLYLPEFSVLEESSFVY